MFNWTFSVFIYLSLKDREAMSADQDEVFSQWGCDRAVDWSTAALRCGMGRVWSHFWALVGTLGHVCHRWVLPTFVLKWWESGWRGLRVGLCGPQRGITGILSLREYEEWGQFVSDLDFRWGSSVLHPYCPSLSLYASLGYFLESIWGLLWSVGHNKAAMATLDISPSCLALCPQSTWNSVLAANFPLELRMNEPSSLFCFICLFFAPCLQPECSRILSIYHSLWGQFP